MGARVTGPFWVAGGKIPARLPPKNSQVGKALRLLEEKGGHSSSEIFLVAKGFSVGVAKRALNWADCRGTYRRSKWTYRGPLGGRVAVYERVLE